MQVNYGTETTITIDMLRHGEPEGGVKYRGHLDDPLSKTGWQQMRHSLHRAKELGWHWDKIISSPLLRCNGFAQEAATELALPLRTVENLKEMGFGDLEGMKPEEAWEAHQDVLSKLWQDPLSHTTPNGEPFGDFSQRVKNALDELIFQNSNQHLLLVVHGGVVRAALYNLIKVAPAASFRFNVPYASFTRFKIYLQGSEHYQADLVFLNNQFLP